METDENGKETARNIYGTNLLQRTVTTRENGNTKEETYSYMYNGHGDVTALLGADGTVVASYYYDAFGNITEQTGSVNNNITYAGYQYDKETDLYYLNARMYDAKTARFLQEDTYLGSAGDPLSLNLYTYCHNEPVMYSDPTGHYYISDTTKGIWNQFRTKIGWKYPGRYELSPQTKSVQVGWQWNPFLPAGSLFNYMRESLIYGVIDGNSATSREDALISLGLLAFGKGAEVCGNKATQAVTEIIDNVLLVKDTGKLVGDLVGKYGEVRVDSAAFDMMDRVGISKYGNNKDELNRRMSFVYSFVDDFKDYFFEMTDFTQTNSMYDYDVLLQKADGVDEFLDRIDSIVWFQADAINRSNVNNSKYKSLLQDFRYVLGQSDKRVNLYDNLLSYSYWGYWTKSNDNYIYVNGYYQENIDKNFKVPKGTNEIGGARIYTGLTQTFDTSKIISITYSDNLYTNINTNTNQNNNPNTNPNTNQNVKIYNPVIGEYTYVC